jgi:hypothetical protein
MFLARLDALSVAVNRLVNQPPVFIRCFNDSSSFQAQSVHTLGDLFLQSCKHFDIDPSQVGVGMRFYWFPDDDEGGATQRRIDLRRTIRTPSDWGALIDDWNASRIGPIISLYLVTGDLSPSIVKCPKPPSPPPMNELDDGKESKSEPASVQGLKARDKSKCVICGHSDHVEAAHIVDKSRAALLDGAPDAPLIEDLRNYLQLCPNHHASFDDYEWTLVQEKRLEGTGFWLRRTPLSRHSSDLNRFTERFIRFSDPSPWPHSFLLKQLGRFPVPCRICGVSFLPSAIWGHYGAAHKDKRNEWADMQHLLPIIPGCSCVYKCENMWDLYLHVSSKHTEVLYL